jgi:rhodanese-related sulfurtransferase
MLCALMTTAAAHSTDPVGRDEIRTRLGAPDLTLVNVLPEEAFAAGRIPGSLSLPLSSIPERARQLLPDLSREIIVYCGGFT